MAYGTVNTDIVADSSGGRLAPISSVFRNRIINGAMVIDQRNAGATVTPLNGTYTLDRWKCSFAQASKFTVGQSTTAPTGFNNSLLATVSSAYTITSTDYFVLSQKVEGFNCADLGWGTANAKTVTISFWVRSSITGTFAVTILNGANDRSYPATYTINAANTWEQKSITIAGDTSGTWLTTNGIGLDIYWNLGTGSTYSGTPNTWQAGSIYSATGATSVVGTNGATFYITGVQLEVGSSATGFEYVNYQTSLANCQRYFQTCVNNTGIANSTTGFRVPIPMQTPMRTTPTLSSAGVLEISYPGVAQFTQSSTGISVDTGSANGVIAQLDNFSGLTAQRTYFFLRANANNPILLSAEL